MKIRKYIKSLSTKARLGAVLFFVLGLIVLFVAGSVLYRNATLKKGATSKDSTEDTAIESTDNDSEDSSSNVAGGTEGTVTDVTPSIIVNSPKPDENVISSRTISGRSKNTNGKIYYHLYGEEAGLVAEGSVTTSDVGGFKDFSTVMSFSRKPIPGDIGSLKLSIIAEGATKELISVKVVY